MHPLRPLALEALTAYGVDWTEVEFLAEETNTTFRVRAREACFALRIGQDPDVAVLDVQTELQWLASLAEAGLPAVRACATPTGTGAVRVDEPTSGRPRTCVLFRWLPGTLMANEVSPRRYRQLGQLLATLHDHAEAFSPPSSFRPLVWDQVFYYPGEPEVWRDPAHAHVMTPDRRAVLDATIDRAQRELSHLSAGPRLVLHGDLHPHNVMVHDGRLTAFDFEDVMLGHPAQDVAITLFYNRQRSEYPALCRSFEDGYRERRAWPVRDRAQLDTLMAARTAMFVNYVLRIDDAPEDYVAEAIERLRSVPG